MRFFDQFKGLTLTRRAHNLAGLALAAGFVGAFYFITGLLFPWCTR